MGWLKREEAIMGTAIVVELWSETAAAGTAAIDAVMAEMHRIDRTMSPHKDDSELTRINRGAASAPVRLSDEMTILLTRAESFARLTGGAFDITVGVFSGVWKFDEDNDGTIPAPELVAARKKLVNWRDLVLDPAKHTARLKKKGQKITLGGIAKGYAVDKAVAVLRAAGLVDFIVQGGGDMYVAGRRGDRRWRVGIRDPLGPRDAFFALTEVEDRTFSTSGDYERSYIVDGKRYHHIIDPRTGHPATASRSVTIWAPNAFIADAIDDAVFILGPEKGLKLVESIDGVAAVIVDARNNVWVSKRLQGKLEVVGAPSDGI